MRRLVHAILLTGFVVLSSGCGEGEVPAATGGSVEPEVEEGFVDAGQGVRLLYRAVGSGGDTLVVLHGGPGLSMDYFFEDLHPLADGLTLIFYDQRGTGGSSLVADSAGLAAERFAEDLEAVRSHFGLSRLNILGHSWGAAVAALYAMRHPDRVRRLVIVGGVPLQQRTLAEGFARMQAGRDSAEVREMQELFAARLADPGNVEVCRAYYVLWFRPFFGVGEAAGRSRGDVCAGSAEARANKMQSVDRFTSASLGEWDWRDSLRGLEAPTLIMHGSLDPIPLAGAQEWTRSLPDARLLLLEGVGHFLYLEAPDRFFPAVREFVRGGWPAGAVAPGGEEGARR